MRQLASLCLGLAASWGIFAPTAAFALPAKAAPVVPQIVRGTQLVALARTEASALVHDGNHVVVEIGVADQSVPAGKLTLERGALQSYGTTYANVPIAIRVNQQLVRTVQVGFRVVTYITRERTMQALPAGHVLVAGDFIRKRIPDDGEPVNESKPLLGRVLISDVAANQSVTLWQTMTAIVIHSGDPVVLVVRDGAVALSADVVARTSGGIGESVIIYDPREDHTMSATVKAPGFVEVQLPEVGS